MNNPTSIRVRILLVLLSALPFMDRAFGQKTPDAKAAPTRHAISFLNGDLIVGSMVSYDAERGIQWKHSDVTQPIQFSPTNVTQIHLGRIAAPDFPPKDACALRLRNGDELEGNLVSLDSQEVVLSTWYGGQLRIPRQHVELISPLPVQLPTVFEGFTSLEGWTVGKVTATVGDPGEWKYADSGIVATEAASLARDLKLPDMSSVEFDVAWRGTLNIALALYTDSLQPISLRSKETEPKFGAFYSLQINSFSVNLLGINQTDPLRSLGSVIIPSLNQRNQARIMIKTDRLRRAVLVFVDGALVKEWRDTENFIVEGRGARIVHQGQGTVRLSNLRVTEWDGRVEQKPQPRKEARQDLGLLLNGDKLEGVLQEVRDGKATFALTGRTLEVPLARVMHLDLAGDWSKTPHAPADAVKAQLSQRGSLTLQMRSWDGQRMVARSPLIGDMNLDARAFTRLYFKSLPQKAERPQ